MSSSSTAGVVSLFDPGFCATDGSFQDGLGDHWYGTAGAVGAWYDLYDTNNTPYDQGDDIVHRRQLGRPRPDERLGARERDEQPELQPVREQEGGGSVAGGQRPEQAGPTASRAR